MRAQHGNPRPDPPLAPAPGELGARNCVLIARARRHSVREFPGPLSIKTVTEGRVAWRINGRDVRLDQSCFLVLNRGEPYSMEIDSAEPVSTRCVFFQNGFVEAAFRDLTQADDACLDDPAASGRELLFLLRLRPTSGGISNAMRGLEEAIRAGWEPLAIDELYCKVVGELLRIAEETRRLIERIPAARAATRSELLKRVSRGRELLHACDGYVPSLAETARTAAMSPFHFQRTFRRVFGVSPSEYVAQLRFERATALLRAGTGVTEVGLEARYAGTAAFSAAFRKRFGMTPSDYAAQFRKKSKAALSSRK